MLLISAGVVVLLVVAFAGWNGARAWWSWQHIDRVEFNPIEARGRLPSTSTSPDSLSKPVAGVVEYETVLAIGSDERPSSDADWHPGTFADAVLFFLVPSDGGRPILATLPRDLMVTDPCTGAITKLNRTLEGCGDEVAGAELVALAVEDFTGIAVDHYAAFGLVAFVDVVDAVGGVRICVEHALRDANKDLLPAGCSVMDGETTLRWIKSRTTQEHVDGEWRLVEGVSDATRGERQQLLMIGLLGRLRDMRSPSDLALTVERLGDAVVLDESLSLSEAIAMVWDLRSVSAGEIRRVVVPTEPVVLDDGSFAVRALTSFSALIEE